MKYTFARYTQINEIVQTIHYFDWDVWFSRPICNKSPVRLFSSVFMAKFDSELAKEELIQFIKNNKGNICKTCLLSLPVTYESQRTTPNENESI